VVWCRYPSLIVLWLIVSVFRVIPLAMASEVRGTLGTTHPSPILALGPVSPRPLSLFIRQQGIWSYVLERDEAHRLHSNSICEVAQLEIHVDYI
jgi:hypothetical protein